MEFKNLITELKDEYIPTDEEERDFWSGEGGIIFYVQQNVKDCFEIEILDSWGCAGGLQEGVGLEYAIEEGCIGLDINDLSEGVEYRILDLNVTHTRGDGWYTDDDSEYDFTIIESDWQFTTRVKQKLSNWWWRSIGWRLKEWTQKNKNR